MTRQTELEKEIKEYQYDDKGDSILIAELKGITETKAEEIERDFKIAEENTERGRKMRERIDEMCYDYTHR